VALTVAKDAADFLGTTHVVTKNQVVIDIGHPWEWARESITNHFESPLVTLLDLPTTPRYRAWHKIGEGLRDLQMTCYRIEQIEYERAHA
jgi:hypothetical protein